MSKLTKKQKQDIADKVECEGFDYFFASYISPKNLGKEYKNEKLVELHENFLKARKELIDFIGLYK